MPIDVLLVAGLVKLVIISCVTVASCNECNVEACVDLVATVADVSTADTLTLARAVRQGCIEQTPFMKQETLCCGC